MSDLWQLAPDCGIRVDRSTTYYQSKIRKIAINRLISKEEKVPRRCVSKYPQKPEVFHKTINLKSFLPSSKPSTVPSAITKHLLKCRYSQERLHWTHALLLTRVGNGRKQNSLCHREASCEVSAPIAIPEQHRSSGWLPRSKNHPHLRYRLARRIQEYKSWHETHVITMLFIMKHLPSSLLLYDNKDEDERSLHQGPNRHLIKTVTREKCNMPTFHRG